MPMAQLSILNGTASPSPTIWLSWNLRLKLTGLNLETMLLLTARPPLETSLAKLLWCLDGDLTLILPAASALRVDTLAATETPVAPCPSPDLSMSKSVLVPLALLLVVKLELLLDSLKSPNTLIGSLVSLD